LRFREFGWPDSATLAKSILGLGDKRGGDRKSDQYQRDGSATLIAGHDGVQAGGELTEAERR
jgi:hypothetical protein